MKCEKCKCHLEKGLATNVCNDCLLAGFKPLSEEVKSIDIEVVTHKSAYVTIQQFMQLISNKIGCPADPKIIEYMRGEEKDKSVTGFKLKWKIKE